MPCGNFSVDDFQYYMKGLVERNVLGQMLFMFGAFVPVFEKC